MSHGFDSHSRGSDSDGAASPAGVPGKRTLSSGQVQRRAVPTGNGPAAGAPADGGEGAVDEPVAAVQRLDDPFAMHLVGSEQVHAAAARGVASPTVAMPHGDAIQRSFGAAHDVSGIKAHVGGAAAGAAADMGASAYAVGDHVAFAASPDLHTAAHEAAHVVQQGHGVQLKGGVGEEGDAYERHADAVADRVVSGQSAAELLDAGPRAGGAPGVQRHKTVAPAAPTPEALRDAIKAALEAAIADPKATEKLLADCEGEADVKALFAAVQALDPGPRATVYEHLHMKDPQAPKPAAVVAPPAAVAVVAPPAEHQVGAEDGGNLTALEAELGRIINAVDTQFAALAPNVAGPLKPGLVKGTLAQIANLAASLGRPHSDYRKALKIQTDLAAATAKLATIIGNLAGKATPAAPLPAALPGAAAALPAPAPPTAGDVAREVRAILLRLNAAIPVPALPGAAAPARAADGEAAMALLQQAYAHLDALFGADEKQKVVDEDEAVAAFTDLSVEAINADVAVTEVVANRAPTIPAIAPRAPTATTGYVVNALTVPPNEPAPAAIAARYAADSFDVGDNAVLAERLAMTVGVNRFHSIDPAKNAANSTLVTDAAQAVATTFPVGVFGFMWWPKWTVVERPAGTRRMLSAAELANLTATFDDLPADRKAKARAEEAKLGGQYNKPYGTFRELVATHPYTQQLVGHLSRFNNSVYIHSGDADAPSLKHKEPGGVDIGGHQKKGLFSRYDAIFAELGKHPLMVIGGYEFRSKPGGGDRHLDSDNPVERLTQVLDDIQRAIRKAIATVDPKGVYPTEPNLVFKAFERGGKPDGGDHDLFQTGLFEGGGPDGSQKLKRGGSLWGTGPAEGRALRENLTGAVPGGEVAYDPRAAVATDPQRFKLYDKDKPAHADETYGQRRNRAADAGADFLTGYGGQLQQDVLGLNQSMSDPEVIARESAFINPLGGDDKKARRLGMGGEIRSALEDRITDPLTPPQAPPLGPAPVLGLVDQKLADIKTRVISELDEASVRAMATELNALIALVSKMAYGEKIAATPIVL